MACGVSTPVGSRWFREGGGMPPLPLAPPSGRYLSFAEREEIALLMAPTPRARRDTLAGQDRRAPHMARTAGPILRGGQLRRLTPREMARTESNSAETDSVAISSFARGDSGMVSVGLNAEELVIET